MQSQDENYFMLRDEEPADEVFEMSQTESQKYKELEKLSQEWKNLDVELKLHNLNISSDSESEEEYSCIDGISEDQREGIYKVAIRRECSKQSYS
jgi:hypothetical protein